jgi:very-short-patch-repair endonuclease
MAKTPLTSRARALRADATTPERRLWSELRNRQLGGWKWKRQAPRGRYVLDFFCADAGLVVELDGPQHADQVDYDERRTAWLESQGLRVLRFWSEDLCEELDMVCETILGACEGPSPSRR